MASIHDLVAKIADPDLRAKIEAEVTRLSKQKKFGLVFEDHMPECTPLYDVAVRRGSKVAFKNGKVNENYTVLKIANGVATCLTQEGERMEAPVEELVTVAEFGDPIYPYLQPIDTVCNAPDSDLWHTLIEADNYHALQLLEYLYAGKVDCIYIDPPYNTGARDWKYNNDYVDSGDSYRHSKWLSFMQKRLLLAKKLLNPKDSVLIVAIDDVEIHNLYLLLQQEFTGANLQVVTTVINPSGKVGQGFSVVHEYLVFAYIGDFNLCNQEFDMLFPVDEKADKATDVFAWESLLRRGSNWTPASRPNLFYPILVDISTNRIAGIGSPTPPQNELPREIDGYFAAWPVKNDGSYAIWRVDGEKLRYLVESGYAYVSGFDAKRNTYAFKYLMSGDIARIATGEIRVERTGSHGEVVATTAYTRKKTPKSVWNQSTHNGGMHGSDLLASIVGRRGFSYPKALYAVCDSLRFATQAKPNALIVDFFAGSGTTLHAVNLLNAEDDGHRRCIMVTNNEVSNEESKTLTAQGYHPGDPEWEALGIARYVTWPRTVCSIEGHDVKGNPLKGTYLGSDRAMADGFPANAAYFKLGFLDKNSVALGRQFREMIPTLWMKAGAHGPCPAMNGDEVPNMLVLPENRFAVLTDEGFFEEFEAAVREKEEIDTIFIVTDYESAFRSMIKSFPGKDAYQLYRDYLDNFRINTGRN